MLKLNFAVPDMPAFKTLGTEPSDLLKPSTPKALAVSMSQFYDNRQFIIPKAFAMEISPALLVNSNSTKLSDYSKNAGINSFRISLGTSIDTILSKNGRNLALGFRITPIDEGDPVRDKVFLNNISLHLKQFRMNESVLRKEFAQTRIKELKKLDGKENVDSIKNIDQMPDWDFLLNKLIMKDSKWKEDYNSFVKDAQEFDKWMEGEKANRKKYLWNATKLDIALSVLSSSPDTLVKNIQFNRAQLWLTYAHRAGKNGQLMIGLNGSIYKDLADKADSTKNNVYWNASLPIRYLFGTNRIKGFLEFQEKYEIVLNTTTNNLLLNLGAELNIIDGFWVNLSGGINNNTTNGITSFIANLNVKLTMPEKFKFF